MKQTQKLSKEAGYTNNWYTPRYIIDVIGLLDNDYCAATKRCFDTALNHNTINDVDGLTIEWEGSVFCNPPYSDISNWLKTLSKHNDGIALIFSRTDTKYFHDYVFGKAVSLYFIKGRLKFINDKCDKGGTATAPSLLIAYGEDNDEILKNIDSKILPGQYVKLG